ncbi:hypothetical protein, partial [Pseudomonas aeruginosa]|uniref:hypothetical protein n=1 Tax=Pseudomonas aeruginosa TaxID=287 RepID=UPI002F90885B
DAGRIHGVRAADGIENRPVSVTGGGAERPLFYASVHIVDYYVAIWFGGSCRILLLVHGLF